MPFPADTEGGERIQVTAVPSDPPTYRDTQGRLWGKNPSNRLTLLSEEDASEADDSGDAVAADEPDAQEPQVPSADDGPGLTFVGEVSDPWNLDPSDPQHVSEPPPGDDPLGNPLAGTDYETKSDDDPDSVG
jgi:hypothetical protein